MKNLYSQDIQKLSAMRALGVLWPKTKILPRYPASMSDSDKAKADALYASMSDDYVNSFGAQRVGG